MIIDGLIDFIKGSPEDAAHMISFACWNNFMDIHEDCKSCKYSSLVGDRCLCDYAKLQKDIEEDLSQLNVKWGQNVTK